jgi:hypothetical protein
MSPAPPAIRVNRAPVLTLWATVVAERLGFPPETALTLGRFVAGSSARAKARRLGISDEKQDAGERHARAPLLTGLGLWGCRRIHSRLGAATKGSRSVRRAGRLPSAPSRSMRLRIPIRRAAGSKSPWSQAKWNAMRMWPDSRRLRLRARGGDGAALASAALTGHPRPSSRASPS